MTDRHSRILGRIRSCVGNRAWEEAVRRVGHAPGALLGTGLSGAAFALPGRRTLKFGDRRDLVAASVLIRARRHPNVAAIHDAFPLGRGRKIAWSAIVRDAVDRPLCEGPKWLEPLFDPFFSILEDAGVLSYEATDRERKRRGWSEFRTASEVLRRWSEHASAHRFSDARVERVRRGILAAVGFLRRVGVPDDTVLNAENIGLRDGRAVVFDVTWPAWVSDAAARRAADGFGAGAGR